MNLQFQALIVSRSDWQSECEYNTVYFLSNK